jgi:hypothetical protein
MIGVKSDELNRKIGSLLPGYMTMGEASMEDMAEMGMPVPPNSIPMMGAKGKHDYIGMGGMFTVLKVRDALERYDDPGWYDNPPGTLAMAAEAGDLTRDGIDVHGKSSAAPASPGDQTTSMSASPAGTKDVLYTCVMHPEVISDKPGKCPKCGMTLVVKK